MHQNAQKRTKHAKMHKNASKRGKMRKNAKKVKKRTKNAQQRTKRAKTQICNVKPFFGEKLSPLRDQNPLCPEICWRFAPKQSKSCLNFAGTSLELRCAGLRWEFAGTSLELRWNFAGTSLAFAGGAVGLQNLYMRYFAACRTLLSSGLGLEALLQVMWACAQWVLTAKWVYRHAERAANLF